MNKYRACIAVVYVIFVLSSVFSEDLAGLQILRGCSFKGVRIPLRINTNVSCDIILDINNIDIQAKKFDFFALPSVPQMVFQGVKIIVATKTNPSLALKSLTEFSGENVQFQRGRLVEVSLVDSSGKILLTANRGSMNSSGTELILNEISLNPSRQEIISEGHLELIGPDSGKLFWREMGKQFGCPLFPVSQ